MTESVSKALKLMSGEEAVETVKFVDMMDKLFDTVNVHNYEHGLHAHKKFQLPYTSTVYDSFDRLGKKGRRL